MKAMKAALVLISLVSSMSYASSYEDGLAWIKSQIAQHGSVRTFYGQTSSGTKCSLYLTDLRDNRYYVVVGFPGGTHPNDYVGMPTEVSTIKKYNSDLIFSSEQSWGNGSTWNRVRITIDSNGRPTRALSTSDVQAIDCLLQ